MLVLLLIFWNFIALFQILSTVVVHGIGWMWGGSFSLMRDIVRIIVIIGSILIYRNIWWNYLANMRWRWVWWIGLVVFGILVSWINASWQLNPMMDRYTISNLPTLILLWVKYGLLYRGMMLSASRLGYLMAQYWSMAQWKMLFARLSTLLIWIMVVGWVWQLAKMIWPDVFMMLGYGGLSDFVGQSRPPLYYLTSYDGFPRLSGLFSWPNEYGYLLMTMFSFLLLHIRRGRRTVWILYVGSLFATISRGALVWVGFQLVLRYWRRYYQWVVMGGLLGMWLLIVLSIWKPESTSTHLMSKVWNAKVIASQPLGYGFGISGPSIHYNSCTVCLRADQCALQPGGVCPYCDCFLPENVYMQLIMEIWILWFLWWLVMTVLWLRSVFRLMSRSSRDDELSQYLRLVLYALVMWFLGLLVEGMFLHVFESSMIHYLFFVPLGLSRWWLLGVRK